MSTKVVLSNVRLLFPVLFDPQPFKNSVSYSLQCDLEGDNLNKILEGVKTEEDSEFLKKKWGVNCKKKIAELKKNKTTFFLHRKTDKDGNELDEYFIRPKRSATAGRPMLLDKNNQVVTEDFGTFYPGCFVHLSLEIYIQSNGDKEGGADGIRCKLLGVKFAKDGDRIDAGQRPEVADFDSIEIEDSDEDLE